MKKRTKAAIATGTLAVGAAGLVAGTGIMGDYPAGADGFLPLPRSREDLMLGLVVFLLACGVVILASRAIGEVLGELIVGAIFPERLPAGEFWESLSPPLRAMVTKAADGGYRRVALSGELLREAMHLPRQRHLRFASRTGGVVLLSDRLAQLARAAGPASPAGLAAGAAGSDAGSLGAGTLDL